MDETADRVDCIPLACAQLLDIVRVGKALESPVTVERDVIKSGLVDSLLAGVPPHWLPGARLVRLRMDLAYGEHVLLTS